MNVSDAAILLLKTYEQGLHGGFAPVAYRLPPQLNLREAEAVLWEDLEHVAASINAPLEKAPLITQSMFDALVCLGFNIGVTALLKSTLMECVCAGEFDRAAAQFTRWDWDKNPKTGRSERVPGLTRRRKAERELFLRDGAPA